MNTNASPISSENSFEIEIEIDEEQDPELFAFIDRIPEQERPAALIALVRQGQEYMRGLTEVGGHTS